MLAETPDPPYYAVIFSSRRSDVATGYDETAERMMHLASQQRGFLGVESAREEVGITVSYWADLESIKRWKAQAEHREAQRMGREAWYASYRVRIARVEREYGLGD
ncbi:antibiotic biosynthesis monooxygenase [Halomonas elongata]|uniref:antibiotic biosynthesis monooxygenase family protein n=1 Tax=Halomonas elongata TaxID=2746 RepID=UPI003345322F